MTDATTTLLSTKQAARLLGVRPQTLRIWRVRGKGPVFIRLGDGYSARAMYREVDIERWISERAVDPTRGQKR